MNQHQHSIETTNPRHPVEQGVSAMRAFCRECLKTHEATRVPLDVAEDILGRPYNGTFADDQVIRVTLACDPNCPAWIRDSRESFHDQHAVVLLGPACEKVSAPAQAVQNSTEDDPALADILATRRRYAAHHDALEGVPVAAVIDELRRADFRVGAYGEDEDGVQYRVTRYCSEKGLRAVAAEERLFGDVVDDEIPTPPAASEAAPAAPKRAAEVLTAADELYDAEVALAFAFMALGRSPSEGVCLDPSENAGLIGLIDRARWIVRDQRKAIVGETDDD